MNRHEYPLSHDELAVLDHVTGLSPVLPRAVGQSCPDRRIAGELTVQRSKLRALAVTPPRMRLCFDDVLNAAGRETPPRRTGRWSVGLAAAASVALALIAGVLATGKGNDNHLPGFHPGVRTDAGEPGVERAGFFHLRHDRPSELRAEVTDLVTLLGGRVTNSRHWDEGKMWLDVSLPTESLPELQKGVTTLSQTTRYETFATDGEQALLQLIIEPTPAPPFQQAWKDGIAGLERTTASLLTWLLAGLPVFGLGGIATLWLSRRRKLG